MPLSIKLDNGKVMLSFRRTLAATPLFPATRRTSKCFPYALCWYL